MESRVDTIAAISTAPGRGGIAVVRVSGPDSWAVAEKVTGRRLCADDAGRFFRARFADVDDGILLVFRAPRSYTGEDAVELLLARWQTVGEAMRRDLSAGGFEPVSVKLTGGRAPELVGDEWTASLTFYTAGVITTPDHEHKETQT